MSIIESLTKTNQSLVKSAKAHPTVKAALTDFITNTMAYWYDGAALAATRSPVIALFWCLIKFTTTTVNIEITGLIKK